MTRRPMEELVVGAARGEPMDVEELERLRAECAGSAAVASELRAQQELTRRLAALRDAMRVPDNAPFDDGALLESFRAAHARRAQARRRFRLGIGAAGVAAAAAAAAIAVVAALRPTLDGSSVPTPVTASSALPADGAAARGLPAAAVFHPLPFSTGVSPGASYSVLRVRIPVSSFPAAYIAEPYSSIEAELLLGPDGIPAAIRFVDPEEVFVTAAADSKER
jgi:predicted nucleic acid-binding protein